ncbi:unnamed protein product, partial [Tetraodon nigroviridis]
AQDQLNKQRAAEMRLDAERKRLREALEAAEARATRVELGRRSLEGELQRLKLSLGDREVESQNSQERYDSLMKQVQQDGEVRVSVLQREVERLSHALLKSQEDESVLKEKMSSLRKSLQEAAASHSAHQGRLAALQKTLAEAERDKRLLQVREAVGGRKTVLIGRSWTFFCTHKDQLEEARASAAEGKRSSASISERIQSLQGELSQSERRREELEVELRNTQELLQQRSASLTEAQRSAQSAQVERATVEERLRGLQRAVAMLETEKKDAERQAVRLEKDKNALRNTLDKVERQKLKTEESSMRLSAAKGRLDRSLNTAEQELQEAQQQILMLQVRIQ